MASKYVGASKGTKPSMKPSGGKGTPMKGGKGC